MKAFFIQQAVSMLVSMIDEATVKKGLDAMFDKIEEEVKRSDNEVDDALVLPVVRTIRAATGIK